MKSGSLWLLAIIASVLLVPISFSIRNVASAAPNAVRANWEHLAYTTDAQKGIGGAEVAGKIMQLGDDGWELVGVETFVEDGTTTKLVYFFKRPK